MNASGKRILHCLEAVRSERERRLNDRALGEKVQALKAWQHARFSRSYADLLASPRYGAAAGFFLEDLYGPSDFTVRDQQFARVVPGLVRLFPHEVVETVVALGELHSLSEVLDTAMAVQLPSARISTKDYGAAWRAVGRQDDRARQIDLILGLGKALERYTRSTFLWHTLRMLRGAAHVAGVGALQDFLESGFRTFRGMRGAAQFLDTVEQRERFMAERLFAGEDLDGSECLSVGRLETVGA